MSIELSHEILEERKTAEQIAKKRYREGYAKGREDAEIEIYGEEFVKWKKQKSQDFMEELFNEMIGTED